MHIWKAQSRLHGKMSHAPLIFQIQVFWHVLISLWSYCTSVVHEAQQVWYELAVLCLFFSHKAQLPSHETQVERFVCGHEFIQYYPCLSCIQLWAQCLCQASQVPAAHGRLGLVRVASSFVRGVANEIWIKSDTPVGEFSHSVWNTWHEIILVYVKTEGKYRLTLSAPYLFMKPKGP